MIPIDSVLLPLKTVKFQHELAIQRTIALLNLKKQGKLSQEQANQVKLQIQKEYEQRKSLYATVESIFTVVDKFVNQQDTQILSRNKNTPLQYDPQNTDVIQSNETNKLLRDICVAEYAARNYSNIKIIEEIENATGLNYSGCYAPMHEAIQKLKEGNNRPIVFLLNRLLKNDQQQKDNFMKLASDNKQLELIKLVKEQYVSQMSELPYFPEHLVTKGLQIFKTQFCGTGQHQEFTFEDQLKCACPCCLFSQLSMGNNASLRTTIRCAKDKVLLDLNEQVYFIPSIGFVSKKYAKEPGARKIVFVY